jgi:hypothetical protein
LIFFYKKSVDKFRKKAYNKYRVKEREVIKMTDWTKEEIKEYNRIVDIILQTGSTEKNKKKRLTKNNK